MSKRESRRGCDRGPKDSSLGEEHLEAYGEMSVLVDSTVTRGSVVPKEKFSLNMLPLDCRDWTEYGVKLI